MGGVFYGEGVLGIESPCFAHRNNGETPPVTGDLFLEGRPINAVDMAILGKMWAERAKIYPIFMHRL